MEKVSIAGLNDQQAIETLANKLNEVIVALNSLEDKPAKIRKS